MKKLLSLLFAVFLCCGLLACSLSPVNYEVHALALAAKPISVGYGDAMQEDYQSFLDKLDLFAARLTAAVYAVDDKESNLCISPVSVYMALALAVECTDGETREELLSAVGVTYDEVKSFTKMLYSFSNKEYGYTDRNENKRVTAFVELANSIWADNDVSLKGAGVEDLANNYNADLFRVDFGSNEGERAIAAYIKDKTHGLIDGDVELSPETLITLINTFYLKDIWNMDGDDLSMTQEIYEFENADGSTTETKLLQGYYFNGRAYEGEGYTSFYTRTNHGFTIKFILPDEGRTLAEVFTAENIYASNNASGYDYADDVNKIFHHTRVLFPEYTASYDKDISAVLKNAFGIKKVFDLAQSDFSSITEAQIGIRAVLHKCKLTVDKKGIEGAAATAVDGGGSPGPSDYTNVYHDFVVDRAFGFVLIDNYGTVLFSGAVNTLK